MNKYIKPFTVLIVGIAIGNRVFNSSPRMAGRGNNYSHNNFLYLQTY